MVEVLPEAAIVVVPSGVVPRSELGVLLFEYQGVVMLEVDARVLELDVQIQRLDRVALPVVGLAALVARDALYCDRDAAVVSRLVIVEASGAGADGQSQLG